MGPKNIDKMTEQDAVNLVFGDLQNKVDPYEDLLFGSSSEEDDEDDDFDSQDY